ncbi:MAG: hypothetical protein OXR72_05145 [Gemmatimonadota bacterium]|nr:hypothetical protein [Gemmatimonadota bacterium]
MQFAEDVRKNPASALMEAWAPVEETFRSCFKIPGEFPSASEKVAVKAGKSAHICLYGWI